MVKLIHSSFHSEYKIILSKFVLSGFRVGLLYNIQHHTVIFIQNTRHQFYNYLVKKLSENKYQNLIK
jgi:hypothetical protein